MLGSLIYAQVRVHVQRAIFYTRGHSYLFFHGKEPFNRCSCCSHTNIQVLRARHGGRLAELVDELAYEAGRELELTFPTCQKPEPADEATARRRAGSRWGVKAVSTQLMSEEGVSRGGAGKRDRDSHFPPPTFACRRCFQNCSSTNQLIYAYARTYIQKTMHIHACIHVRTHACMHSFTCMHVCAYFQVCMHSANKPCLQKITCAHVSCARVVALILTHEMVRIDRRQGANCCRHRSFERLLLGGAFTQKTRVHSSLRLVIPPKKTIARVVECKGDIPRRCSAAGYSCCAEMSAPLPRWCWA